MRRAVTQAMLRSEIRPVIETPCTVRIVRCGPRELDDDNLETSCKAVRDEVAAWLGVDDGARSGVFWRYGQELSPTYHVTLEITRGARYAATITVDADADGREREAEILTIATRIAECLRSGDFSTMELAVIRSPPR